MTVRRPPARAPKLPTRSGPQLLTLRWFIIAISGIGSYLLGATAGDPASGVLLSVVVVGLLHSILE